MDWEVGPAEVAFVVALVSFRKVIRQRSLATEMANGFQGPCMAVEQGDLRLVLERATEKLPEVVV